MKFKKNLHLAKRFGVTKVRKAIRTYPKQFPVPKYLIFIKRILDTRQFEVKIYTAGVSKYIFIIHNNDVFKIRFSNHRPIKQKEEEEDCDYYVGVSHLQVSTTDQVIQNISQKTGIKINNLDNHNVYETV